MNMRGKYEANRVLSEDDLVVYLRRSSLGMTKRCISSWRAKRLLPAFDIQGKGSGRGRGRRLSYWSQGEKIIKQAIAVHEALSFHPRIEDAYLPLWLFGCEIDVETARKKLLEEIGLVREVLAEGPGSHESLEDYFFDKASDLFAALLEWDQHSARDFTFEHVEQFVQMIANPAYRPDDPPSVEWQFVREHFLLTILEKTVANLLEDELQQLRDDYCFFIEGISLLVSALPSFPSEFPQKYWVGGNAGFFFVLFDLAFRRAGYGDFIDQHLPRLPVYIQLGLDKRAAGESDLQLEADSWNCTHEHVEVVKHHGE
jgi:hypothetical protein